MLNVCMVGSRRSERCYFKYSVLEGKIVPREMKMFEKNSHSVARHTSQIYLPEALRSYPPDLFTSLVGGRVLSSEGFVFRSASKKNIQNKEGTV